MKEPCPSERGKMRKPPLVKKTSEAAFPREFPAAFFLSTTETVGAFGDMVLATSLNSE